MASRLGFRVIGHEALGSTRLWSTSSAGDEVKLSCWNSRNVQ